MTDIFLSVSFVDADVVRSVHERLPRGVARYYERSFERSEDLIAAMERALEASEIFVFFASRTALKSYAVNFEIEEARRQLIFGRLKKVLVFPLEPGLTFGDLPKWMQQGWIPNAGESPSDIARYLTTTLLEPGRGISVAAPNVVGRGATMDATRRLTAAHLQKHRESPRVLIFPGITGIGRRTFAAYYLRNGLAAEANLPFGPTIQLSAQAELVDLYRALRVEVDSGIRPAVLAQDQEAFELLGQVEQVAEIINVIKHFTRLSQAVTIISAAGLFEDAATPKSWVKLLFQAVPPEQVLVIVSNLQFRSEFVDELGVAIQLRITELHSDDIRALVIFTASLLGLKEFNISNKLVSAIGGHPDVANAAVRLASQKGTAILERDPRQLFNIQRAIIGEAVMPNVLKPAERLVLDVLGWLPTLGSDLLEKILVGELGQSADDFHSAIEGLILGCLVYAIGYHFSIASAVRHLYRRHNVTSPTTLEAMARVFARAWAESVDQGFRDDLFSAFVFMHLLEGKSLPVELRRLLTPSNLYEAVRDAYARGKSTENKATIQQAIEWGATAFNMNMTDSVREEILSTVARAQTRLGHFDDANKTIDEMRRRSYRQVVFLEGHLLRKRRKFDKAIPKLRFVLDHNRGHRAAVHELAICYRRLHWTRELKQLLEDHGDALDDSAEFLDFSIALQISRGDLGAVPAAIERLRQIDDTSNRADLRHAQYLSRRTGDKGAFQYLSHVLEGTTRQSVRLRAARAFYAARSGQTKVAREDLSMLRSIGESETRARTLEIHILLAEGRAKEALEVVRNITPEEPGDWLARATVLEAVAAEPSTGLNERSELMNEAQEIRTRFSGDNGVILDN